MLTPSAHREMIASIRATLAVLEANAPAQCCLNCDNYQEGYCTKWSADVPEQHRQEGCERWQESIPF